METKRRGEKLTKKKGFEKDTNKLKRHHFQDMVVETLLKTEENIQKISEEDEKEIESTKEMCASVNLSNKHLEQLSEELLQKLEKVQYLYLEGNKLLELPTNFFQNLCFIKWLDLRNNHLTEIPTSGLRNHGTLEVILLQGNRVRNLPTELATIPSLKGLQITGNPIVNIPYEAIAEGFKGVITHLKKLHSQSNILLPEPKTFIVKPQPATQGLLDAPTDSELRIWDLEKLSQWQYFMRKKHKAGRPKVFNTRSTTFNICQKQTKISVSVQSHSKIPTRAVPFRCGTYQKNNQKRSRMRYTRLGYKRKPITAIMIQDKIRKDAYNIQTREILEKQARKIQRMRDKEVLKSWREKYKLSLEQMRLLDNFQEYPTKDFASRSPFDIDPEFLKMLNRIDIYRTLKAENKNSSRIKTSRARVSYSDLEKQMNEIMKKLQKLDTNEEENMLTPRTKQNHVCQKISKILNIQKTIRRLMTLNTSLIEVIPAVETKNIETTKTISKNII